MIRLGGQLVTFNESDCNNSLGTPSNHSFQYKECDMHQFTKYLGLALICLFVTFGTIGNSIVAIVLAFKRRLMPSSTTLFIINLSVSDLLSCLAVMPFDIVYWLYFPQWKLGPEMCKLWNALFYALHASSSFSIAAISVDTYKTVAIPLKRQSLEKIPNAVAVICVAWFWCFTIGFLMFNFQEDPPAGAYLFDLNPIAYGIYLLFHIILPQLVASYCYFKLFRIARSHAINIKSMQVSESTTSRNYISKSQESLNFKEEVILAKTFLLVTIAYIFCWNPFLAVQLVYVFKFENNFNWCTLETIDTVVCWLAYLQCCLNPVFYALRKKYFRKLFARTVRNV